MPKGVVDLFLLTEDDRIRMVGEHAATGAKVAFVVDNDAIADRYVEKLMQRYPVIITQRTNAMGCVWLRAEKKPT